MSHVFISYNQADADFAALMMMQIEKAGFETWMDKSRLRPGNDWSQEIDQGINDAFALVVVMSPEAKASEYVTYEWSFALGAGIPVIPVMLKGTELHPRLSRVQYINFTHDRIWERLTSELAILSESRNSTIRIPKDTPPYLRHAISALDNPNPADRIGAIDALKETDHPLASEALIASLDHPLRDVRFAAALVLGHRGDERAAPNLLSSLPRNIFEEFYEEELQNLQDALVSIGLSATSSLLEFLDSVIAEDENRNISLEKLVIEVLGELGAQQAIPTLKRYAQSDNIQLQTEVLDALAKIDQSTAISIAAELWSDIGEYSASIIFQTAEDIALMSGTKNNLSLIDIFKESLTDSNPIIRSCSALALYFLSGSDEKTRELLATLSKDTQEVTYVPRYGRFDEALLTLKRDEPITVSDISRVLLFHLSLGNNKFRSKRIAQAM